MSRKLTLDEALVKVRCIADYQFSRGAGKVLFPPGIRIEYSRRTGKIRYIYFKGRLIATLRPTYGTFSLTSAGFKRLTEGFKPPKFRVVVLNRVAALIKQGRTVFAKHVKDADSNIRPRDEVAVTDEDDEIIAVGKATLSGVEMLAFDKGVAVKVRHGINES